MEVRKFLTSSVVLGIILLSSCGTIIGGSKYNAYITVVNNPRAQIIYNGAVRGTGSAVIKVKRSEANQFSFTVQEEGCKEQTFHYTSRSFRGWAFAGSVIFFTSFNSGIPLPWGVGLDLATGAVWKPSTWERGVFKDDYKNYRYEVTYTNCQQTNKEPEQVMLDVVYLKNGSIIKGTIIEQIINVQIKLQTKDGSIFVYKYEEIEKISKEQAK